jgi:cardiolipin synthase
MGAMPKPSVAGPVIATLRERGTIAATAIELVRGAKRELLVASFGWDADHDVVAEVCARAKAGVQVTVLARVRVASMPALLTLVEAGVRVMGFPYLHAKAILADGVSGIVMSANLQRHGLDDGIELGLRLDGSRLEAVRALLSGWIDVAPFELRTRVTLGEVLGAAQVWTEKQLVPWSVSNEATVQMEPVTARSADVLDSDPPSPRRRFGLPHPAHELSVEWDVVAPRLAPKSKELDAKLGKAARPGDPLVFREPNGRVVVGVTIGDELARAREIAKQIGAAAIVVREKPR